MAIKMKTCPLKWRVVLQVFISNAILNKKYHIWEGLSFKVEAHSRNNYIELGALLEYEKFEFTIWDLYIYYKILTNEPSL